MNNMILGFLEKGLSSFKKIVLVLLCAGSVTVSIAFPEDSIRKYSLGIEVSAIGTRLFRSDFSEKIAIDYFNSTGLSFQISRFFISSKYQQFTGKIEKNLTEQGRWLEGSVLKFGMALMEVGADFIRGQRLTCSLSAAGGMSRATSLFKETGISNEIVKSGYRPFYVVAAGLKWIPGYLELKGAFFDELEFFLEMKSAYYSDFTADEFKLRGDTFQVLCMVGWRFCW